MLFMVFLNIFFSLSLLACEFSSDNQDQFPIRFPIVDREAREQLFQNLMHPKPKASLQRKRIGFKDKFVCLCKKTVSGSKCSSIDLLPLCSSPFDVLEIPSWWSISGNYFILADEELKNLEKDSLLGLPQKYPGNSIEDEKHNSFLCCSYRCEDVKRAVTRSKQKFRTKKQALLRNVKEYVLTNAPISPEQKTKINKETTSHKCNYCGVLLFNEMTVHYSSPPEYHQLRFYFDPSESVWQERKPQPFKRRELEVCKRCYLDLP